MFFQSVGKFREEIAAEGAGYAPQQGGVDGFFIEDLIDMCACDADFICQPCGCASLSPKFSQYDLTDVHNKSVWLIVRGPCKS